MVQIALKKKQAKEKVKSDIVFCIDVSGSMTPCIEGVKANVRNFVRSIENDPQLSIDWRLGFLAHTIDGRIIFRKLDFTTDISRFISALGSLNTFSDEVNFPAIDWCLDFPWRKDVHKFVISFTDEPIDTGWKRGLSMSRKDELKQKILDLGVNFFMVSFDYPEYQDLCSVDRGRLISIGDYGDFSGVKFGDLMNKLAISVSTGSRGRLAAQKPVKKDIYGIAGGVKLITM